jgi:DNA-binding protein HU-beta
MNKSSFVTAIAEKTGFTKKDVEKMLDACSDVVIETLKSGDKVQLVGFGTFEAKKRAPREGINPQTKEKIQIAASVVPGFKAGKSFKDALN